MSTQSIPHRRPARACWASAYAFWRYCHRGRHPAAVVLASERALSEVCGRWTFPREERFAKRYRPTRHFTRWVREHREVSHEHA